MRYPLVRVLSLGWTAWVASTWTAKASKVIELDAVWLFPLHPLMFSLWGGLVFNALCSAMQARKAGGEVKRGLLDQHLALMFAAHICCMVGVGAIVANKVINKGQGLLFVGVSESQRM